MLEQLKAGQVSLSDERLGENYGRAALNLLVQLVPLVNRQETYAGMDILRAVHFSKLMADISRLIYRLSRSYGIGQFSGLLHRFCT